ncbi:hypothetical protein LSUE1_G007286, partial [Lachnellula suecica]
MLYKCVVFSLFCSLVSALALSNDPAAATYCPLKAEEKAPQPTQPPNIHDLRLRDVAQKTLLAAPDNTCGFFGGNLTKPWGCSASSTCVFATAIPEVTSATSTSSYISYSFSAYTSISTTTSLSTSVDAEANVTSFVTYSITETLTLTDTSVDVLTGTDTLSATTTIAPTTAGSVLCCDNVNGCPTAAPTACVDRGQYEYNKTCTGSCPDDAMTLKCTSGIYLYCATLLFPTPSVTALYCDYLSTYPASPFLASTATNASFTSTVVTHFHTTPSSASPSPTSTNTSGKSSASATAAAASGGKGGSKGPIIGGVVGGLAALALVAGLVIMVLRRRRAKEVPKEGSVEGVKGGGKVVVQE